MLVTIITFIIVFGVIVLVHEYGHYFFAQRAGILVREFSIGMGPKVWWHRGKNGTTFTIRILPLGGYVRLAGADDEDEETLRPGTPVTLQLNDDGQVVTINASSETTLFQGIPLQITGHDLVDGLWIKGYVNGDESEVKQYSVNHDATLVEDDGTRVRIAPRDVQFRSASLGNRMLTNFAGPFNNFVLSLVVFVLLGFTLSAVPTGSNVIGQVTDHGVADRAGLVKGDQITAVDGQKTTSWQALSTQISSHPGKNVKLAYTRKGVTHHVDVTPQSVKSGRQRVGRLGIIEQTTTSPSSRLSFGWREFTQSGALIFQVLGHMLTHGFNVNDFGGPVAMYAGTSQATKLGINGVLSFLAMLSINLGIVNLLPIPALDGGKLLLNIIEAIIRRPIPEQTEAIVNFIGFALLMVLMVVVTWNDIQKYFIH